MVRCFVAVDFPREVIQEIERIDSLLKKKNLFAGKFTEPESLHLTLKFLGEVEENSIDEIKDKLSKIESEKFDAYLGNLGVFSSNFIRILWVRILGKKLIELQKKIDDSLSFRFPKENRFMAHLTIARIKNVKDRKIFLGELEKINISNIKFEINRFYLMKSDLKPDGPEYSILGEFLLK